MGRLLSHQLKENIRATFLILLVPLFLTASFMFLTRFTNNTLASLLTGLSMFVMFCLGIAAVVKIIEKDYSMYFGKEAIFYESLPIKNSKIVGARFLNYLISALYILVFIIFDNFILSLVSGNGAITAFLESFKGLGHVIGMYFTETPILHILLQSLTLISCIAAAISLLIYAMSIGSEKKFKRFGKLGPVIIYLVVNVIQGAITSFVLYKGLDSSIYVNANTYTQVLNASVPFGIIVLVLNLIFTAYFIVRSIYSLDKKLSVA